MSRSFGGRSFTTRSPMVISPPVISSSPATMRSVVDLPQPDGPTSTTNSLSRMWRFTSLTACTSSYFLFRSFMRTCAMMPSLGVVTLSGSALHGAGEAGHVVFDEEGIYQGHGDGAQEGSRHQLAPEIDVAPDQLGDDAHGDGLALGRREEDQGV